MTSGSTTLALLCFGIMVGIGCSDTAPLRPNSSSANSKSSDVRANVDDDEASSISDDDDASNKKEEDPSDKEDDKSKEDEETVPATNMEAVVTPKVPVESPEAIKKSLEEECTPASALIKINEGEENNGSTKQAYELSKASFSQAEIELIAIAKKDCLSIARKASDIPRVNKDVKRVSKLTVRITARADAPGAAWAIPGSSDGEVYVSVSHIMNYASASAESRKVEFWGVMTHEILHLYQKFNSLGKKWLSEGLCDAVRADELLYDKNRKVKGKPYDGSYTATGFFLRYLRKRYDPELYPKFNNAVPNFNNDNFWMENFGKSVHQLYDDFQKNGFDPNDW